MVPIRCLLPTSPSRFLGSPALFFSQHPTSHAFAPCLPLRCLPACFSTLPDEQSPQVCRAVKGCVSLIDWKSSCACVWSFFPVKSTT